MLGLVDDSVKLTYEEMKEKWLGIVQIVASEEATMYSMFNNLDMNGDSKIHINEWQTHYQSIKIPLEHAWASFDAIDTNHDGFISKEAFYAYHHQFFTFTEDTLHSCGRFDKP